MKEQGILLIAIGQPFYKEMAYNMALSLRAAGWEEITLLTDDGGYYYSMEQRKAFTEFVTADEHHMMEGWEINPFRLKTFINHYTPYKKTLYLDADGLFMFLNHSVEELFSKLSGWQMHEVARYTKDTIKNSEMIWLKKGGFNGLEQMWSLYGLRDEAVYTETNSSFIYFEQNDETESFFESVRRAYLDRKLPFTKIGRHYPDELAWNITCARTNTHGAIERFRPLYFDYENRDLPEDQIPEKFYFLGLAGGYINRRAITLYNNLVKHLRIKHGDGNKFSFDMAKKAYHVK